MKGINLFCQEYTKMVAQGKEASFSEHIKQQRTDIIKAKDCI